jgi:acyl carrier protein
MEKNSVQIKVREIIISVLKHEGFVLRDDLVAAEVDGWDSLTHMIIITTIEKEFNIKFKLKELNKLKTAGTLIELIQSKL